MRQDDVAKRLQAAVSLKEAEFATLKNELIAKFLTEYDGEEAV